MNLYELKKNVMYLLNEDGIFRTDDVIVDSINVGHTVLCAMTHAREVTEEFALKTDKHFMVLPAKVLSTIAVYIGGNRLWPARLGSLDMLSETWLTDSSSIPIYYTLSHLFTPDPRIWFHPRSNTDVTVKIVYSQLPNTMVSDSDVPLIPYDHHYGIVLWAQMWELLKERASVIANKAFRVALEFVEHANLLRDYMYRRTPNRDWQIPPIDSEAVRQKMFDFARTTKTRLSDQFTTKDMAQ